MIYEIIAVIYLLFTLIVFAVNLEKDAYKNLFKLNSKKLKEDEKIEVAVRLLLFLFLALFSFLFTVLFMFWTASKGIIFAKYYAFAFIGWFVMSFLVSRKVKSANVPLRSKILRYLTTIIEVAITIYALWRVI